MYLKAEHILLQSAQKKAKRVAGQLFQEREIMGNFVIRLLTNSQAANKMNRSLKMKFCDCVIADQYHKGTVSPPNAPHSTVNGILEPRSIPQH